jgi:hypothetical protein
MNVTLGLDLRVLFSAAKEPEYSQDFPSLDFEPTLCTAKQVITVTSHPLLSSDTHLGTEIDE